MAKSKPRPTKGTGYTVMNLATPKCVPDPVCVSLRAIGRHDVTAASLILLTRPRTDSHFTAHAVNLWLAAALPVSNPATAL